MHMNDNSSIHQSIHSSIGRIDEVFQYIFLEYRFLQEIVIALRRNTMKMHIQIYLHLNVYFILSLFFQHYTPFLAWLTHLTDSQRFQKAKLPIDYQDFTGLYFIFTEQFQHRNRILANCFHFVKDMCHTLCLLLLNYQFQTTEIR